MKICLVTTFPPSRRGLSEYGFHIARELQRNPMLSLTVLADELPESEPELEDFSVVRCWSFDRPASLARLLGTIGRIRPDVVWFNLLFTTFGHNPAVAFAGLATPLLSRMYGVYTHVTLHHLMDGVDLGDARVRFPRLYRAGGAVATRLLLLSNSMSVLLPGYRRILREKYNGQNVHVRRHGMLAQRPEYPDFSLRGQPVHRVLAFGKWGTYKRLEPLISAFQIAAAELPEMRLVIAGTDHPRTPGYLESVARQYRDDKRIEFAGYVAEGDVPQLFRGASVAVMPYSSSTGSSGVAHLACAYGVPVVCADIPDFRQMQEEEGLGMEFYQPGSAPSLAECLVTVLRSPDKQRALAEQNFTASLRMTIPQVVHDYLRHFDREQRTKALKPMMRLWRLPAWLPASCVVGSRAKWNWRTLGRGTARLNRSAGLAPAPGSVDYDTHRGGDVDVARGAVDRNGIGIVPGGSTSSARTSAARREPEEKPGYSDDEQCLEYAAALRASYTNPAENAGPEEE